MNSVKDLVSYARANPGKLNFGNSGIGTSTHLATVLFMSKTNLNLVSVVYKGASQALVDLLGAQIQVLCTSTLPALPHVRSGQLRALAVTTAARSRAVPDIPTVAEAANLPGFNAIFWQAMVVPAGTPKPIVDRLYAEAVRALKMPDVIERLATQGGNELIGNTPEQFAALVRDEIVQYGKVIRQARTKPRAFQLQ